MGDFNNGRDKLAAILLAAGLLLAALPASAGPVMAPGRRLFVIKTAHFDIFFPEASRPSALRLSSIAESVYDEVSSRLGAELPARMPVLITPDQGSLNGYMSPLPYARIVLYDKSLDLGWTAFKDNFRNLFLHELTHAVSLQIRAPWAAFLSGIFGSWVLPSTLNAPEFMVEGAAVSLESDEPASGRANDPLVKERVRQDILENRFKSPIEASGLYDEYPFGSIYYEYGGLFNAYIQRKYGMEKYAELWKAMGNLVLTFTLDPYEIAFYAAFHRTYGIPFEKAWSDFRSSLELGPVADAPEPLGARELAWMPGGLAGNEAYLYWIDARSHRALRMDAATLQVTKLFDADSGSAISDATPPGGSGGDRLLVSRELWLPDGRSREETLVYDLGQRRFDPASAIPDLREARLFRDGFVGIASRLHDSDLLFASGAGTHVLLHGSAGIMFSQPAPLDDRRIALIVAVEGRRSIGILDADSGILTIVRVAAPNEALLGYVRQLSASGGKLLFNYDPDDRFYKLGLLDPASGEIELEGGDFSGGVHWPRSAAGRVFYIGKFSEGDRICRYPAVEPSARLACGFEPFDPEPAYVVGETAIALEAGVARIEPYRPLAYANPFNEWLPYLDLAHLDRSLRVFGIFYFQDPTEDNSLSLNAGYDSAYPFADASLSWKSLALPVALQADLGDVLAYGASGAPERQSSASLTGTLTLPAFPSPRGLELSLGATLLYRADGSDGSPYEWSYSGPNVSVQGIVGWFGRLPGAAKDSARGLDLLSFHDLDAVSLTYKTEAELVASIDRPSLRLELWGAWANSSILKLDSTSDVFASDHRPAYVEYQGIDQSASELLAEGSLSCRLADAAIHANILELYFNRLLVDTGFRGAWFDGRALSSAFLRLSLDLAAAEGEAAGGARVFGEGFLRLDGSPFAEAYGLRLGLRLSTDAAAPLRGASVGDRGGSY